MRTAEGDTPTVTLEDIEIDATETPTPRLVAAGEPPSATPAEPEATCQPGGDGDRIAAPPTIAPMNGDVPPATGEDDPCAPAPTAEPVDSAEATATMPVTPEPTDATQVVIADATAIPTAETVPAGETPTEAAVGGGDEPTATTAIVEMPSDTPVPVVSDTPAAVATQPSNDGVTLPGGTDVSVETEVVVEPTASVAVTSTGEQSTGVDGLEAAEVVVPGLPLANAPGGPLPVSPDQSRFVVGVNGGPLVIVDFNGNAVPINGTDPFYPVWSPDGARLLIAYYPVDSDGSSLGVVEAGSGEVSELTTQDGDTVHRDVPAGWLGQTPVFQRTYLDEPGRGVELWRAGEATPFWSMEDVEVYTAYPVSLRQSFLLATSAGWLEVGSGGDVSNLGPSPITDRISAVAVGPAGMLAYAGQGQLVIASVASPGSATGVLSYPDDGGGFDWSPDGSQLVIANGSGLTFITPDGESVATLEGSGGSLSGPYWMSQGILFIDGASADLQRIPVPA